MALNHGTKPIVTDGLVLCLDAANKNSYPGSGTTWTDLSGEGNNSTMVGDAISYDSTESGFNFQDGPSSDTNADYFSLPNTAFTLGEDFTIEIWNYYDSASTPTDTPWEGGCLYTNSAEDDWSSGAGNNNGLLFGYNSIVYRNTSASEIQVDLSTSPATRIWHQHVMIVDSGTGKIYVDKIQLATLSNMRTYTQSSGTLGIGTADKSGGNYRGEYLGYISIVRVYTRALTATEIQQNFEAHRGRFGI